jgi:hypothetical protein
LHRKANPFDKCKLANFEVKMLDLQHQYNNCTTIKSHILGLTLM